MDRRNHSLIGSRNGTVKIGLAVSTALASLALAGCTASAPPAQVSFDRAQDALMDGRTDRAIAYAEEAVLGDPRNGMYRATLGAAYLEAGRFQAAATSFGDALDLGQSDPRTVLSYALASIALGDAQSALEVLGEYEGSIPAADYGLAVALAGQPERGVHILINTVRNGTNSPKARQNLAYAYALAGNWRAARVMAAEDVPADQLDRRLSEWAASARPEDYQLRVSSLLGITPAADGGQPQYLALANFPSQGMLVAEAQAMRADEMNTDVAEAPAVPRESEALAFGVRDIDTVDPDSEIADAAPAASAPAPAPVTASAPAPVRVAAAPSVETAPVVAAPTSPVRTPAPAATEAPAAPVRVPAVATAPSGGAMRFVSSEVAQDVPATPPRPARAASPAPAPVRAAASQPASTVATGASATHLIQLGAFESRAVAESKWREMTSRFPQLAAHDVVITEAVVNGRTYFRVAAAGFGARSARQMCGTVQARGQGCFAYAASNPPAGAVDRGVRIAANR